MARLRLAVALLVPPPLSRDLDVLRRALGETDLDRVAPHVTLVPPINLPTDTLGEALARLRSAAAQVDPFELRLGPVTSFTPVTPTIHLAVSGDVASLEALYQAVHHPPLWRRPDFPFVPHVTLLEQAPLHRIRAAGVALDRFRAVFVARRVTLLSHVREARAAGRWRPLADADLAGVQVVGRGGLPIELASGGLLDPEAVTALDLDRRVGRVGPVGRAGRVVVARCDSAVVGAAWGPGPVDRRVVDDTVDPDLLTAAWRSGADAAGPRRSLSR